MNIYSKQWFVSFDNFVKYSLCNSSTIIESILVFILIDQFCTYLIFVYSMHVICGLIDCVSVLTVVINIMRVFTYALQALAFDVAMETYT